MSEAPCRRPRAAPPAPRGARARARGARPAAAPRAPRNATPTAPTDRHTCGVGGARHRERRYSTPLGSALKV